MYKISITGPESSGKSWLAKSLALHYHTLWVQEYAREYLENKTSYTYHDILLIAQEQKNRENVNVPSYLFCDTDMLVCKIWCEYKYGKCHPWIEQAFKKNDYDLYLLCDIDLPWEYDALRENPTPNERVELLHLYQQSLDKEKFPYVLIQGEGNLRLQNSIKTIQTIFN